MEMAKPRKFLQWDMNGKEYPMSKAIFVLMLALVTLGFLASTTMNLYGDMEQLRAENQKLALELNQLRSSYDALAQENGALKTQKDDLLNQLGGLQAAYAAENQARLTAESELANYRSMVANMANTGQTKLSAICPSSQEQATKSVKLLSSEIVPAGAGTLAGLVITSLILILINLHRRQKKSRSLPSLLRNHR
jgi:cell division protein FtsB